MELSEQHNAERSESLNTELEHQVSRLLDFVSLSSYLLLEIENLRNYSNYVLYNSLYQRMHIQSQPKNVL